MVKQIYICDYLFLKRLFSFDKEVNRSFLAILVIIFLSSNLIAQVKAPSHGLYIQGNYLYVSSGSYIYVEGDTYGDITIDGELSNYGTIKLESDWTNNSTYTAGSSSLVEFIGGTTQNVTSGGDDFANVNIENSVTPSATDGVVLADDMTISETISLNDGIIITGSNDLIISDETTSNITSPNYSNSWVYGNILRAIDATAGTGTYDFPVGTTVSPNLAQFVANSLDGITNLHCYFKITPTTPNLNFPTNLEEDDKKYNEVEEEGVWVLTPTGSITSGTYDLKLYFNGFSGLTDELFSIVSRPSDLNNGTNWEICSGSFSATNVADGYAYRTGINTFSEKGIGKAEIILPIDLLYFDAKCDNESVLLDWVTSSETNNDYFTLYKSADAVLFEPFEVVNGAGNSNNTLKYSSIDNNPYSGISYYKLKQTDFDGKYTYFKVIPVQCKSSLADDVKFNVYPVPVSNSDNLFISISGIEPQKEVSIVLMDVLGKVYFSKPVFSNENGTVSEALRMHNRLPSGVYIITASINSVVYQELVIVK